MQKKLFAGACALALAAFAAACSQNSTSGDASGNTAATNTTVASNSVPGPDNSEITTVTSDGVKTETRTFKDPNSKVEKVVVTTRDGKRTARVYYRDKTEKDLEGNDVEQALSATGDALVKAGSVVADKVEDVPHEVDDAGRAVGRGAKKVGEVVGDKAEDVGSATAKGAKKAGKATVKGAKKVGSAVKSAVTP